VSGVKRSVNGVSSRQRSASDLFRSHRGLKGGRKGVLFTTSMEFMALSQIDRLDVRLKTISLIIRVETMAFSCSATKDTSISEKDENPS